MHRRTDIDRAKGLAILLVVFGHIVARADPAGVDWYEPLRRAVYAFHMPFFFYLSGMAAVCASGVFVAPAGWGRFAADLAVCHRLFHRLAAEIRMCRLRSRPGGHRGGDPR